MINWNRIACGYTTHMPSQIALLSINVFLHIMQCFMIDAAKKINIAKIMYVYGYTNANVAF